MDKAQLMRIGFVTIVATFGLTLGLAPSTEAPRDPEPPRPVVEDVDFRSCDRDWNTPMPSPDPE